MIKIDDRLNAICRMVDRCKVLLDVGSDHAYVPVWLFQNGVIDEAVISDVNRGPVEVAKKNLERFGYLERSSFVISDGFKDIDVRSVDTACICGMGGELICDIIRQDFEKAKSIGTLVLQPMNSKGCLRRYLYDSGFTITGEDIAVDGRHFYNVIKAVYRKDERSYDDIFFDIGYYSYEHGNRFFVDYLDHLISKNRVIIDNCRNMTSIKAVKAADDARKYIELITGVKESYESKRFNQVH